MQVSFITFIYLEKSAITKRNRTPLQMRDELPMKHKIQIKKND